MTAFGTLLKELREAQRYSQLALAVESEVSSKHISFLETGRSLPSREMVLQLARTLNADLTGTNQLLSSAGYSQQFSQMDLNAPEMGMVKEALQHMLQSHMPYPAMVMDRDYNLIAGNNAQLYLMQQVIQLGGQVPDQPNLLLALLDEKGFKPYLEEWENLACHMLQRVHQEHLSGPFRDQTCSILEQAMQLPGIPTDWRSRTVADRNTPVVSFRIRLGNQLLSLFSTIATFGTPLDITAQNVRVEYFFPSDEETRQFWLTAKLP